MAGKVEAFNWWLARCMQLGVNTTKEGMDVGGVVGRKVEVKWKHGWEEGVVEGWDGGKFTVRYKDGDVKGYKLWKKEFKFIT
ncbi:hypothetical protein TrCOL_g10991 [Triparma columacea]|uniref:Uncharacterized protein n=1 Tax=Triparma columacea TaxID=722753 RepID=A0A9W7L9R6_9STRA|nr:hypothetical protein TrCOL_g10991 [Triparma columacea]